MKKLKLEGKIFGSLTVLSYKGCKPSGKSLWECMCNCGTTCTILGSCLTRGTTKSCGCLKKSTIFNIAKYKQDYSTHPLTGTWKAMKSRCTNQKDKSYEYYGGRGITVCDRWMEPAPQGFLNFLEDMGERPEGTTLDRIDVNGNYEPSNCRWAEASLQGFNQRLKSNNTSGKTGVYYSNTQKWIAKIVHKGVKISLGSYSTFEEAVKAREEGELKYYGEIKR